MIEVKIYDDGFERGYRKFKKMVDQEGILARCKEIEFYVKPSQAKKLKRMNNRNRKFSKYPSF